MKMGNSNQNPQKWVKRNNKQTKNDELQMQMRDNEKSLRE